MGHDVALKQGADPHGRDEDVISAYHRQQVCQRGFGYNSEEMAVFLFTMYMIDQLGIDWLRRFFLFKP
jgi:hypothetical protein